MMRAALRRVVAAGNGWRQTSSTFVAAQRTQRRCGELDEARNGRLAPKPLSMLPSLVQQRHASSSSAPASTTCVSCGGRQVSFRPDVMAWQADGSIIAEDGGSAVLSTAVLSGYDYQRGKRFKISYHEPDASVNVIFKNFLRRQLSETEREVLASQVMKEVIQPRLRGNHSLNVSCRVLSADGEADPVVLAINAAAAALQRAGVDWDGPIAGVRVAMANTGALLINPSLKSLEAADWNLLYVGDSNGPQYLSTEGKASIEPADLMAAVTAAHGATTEMLECIGGISANPQREAIVAPSLDESIRTSIGRYVHEIVKRLAAQKDALSRHRVFDAMVAEYLPSIGRLFPMESPRETEAIALQEIGREVAEFMHTTGKRIDGRRFDEARPLQVEQGVVSIPHGSALVALGASQCFARTTLDPTTFSNPIDEVATKLGGAGTNFFVDYKMPSYSTRNSDTLSRTREHFVVEGSMVASAVLPVLDSSALLIPTRVHCEVNSHDGSNEAVAAIASSVALIDAGVKTHGLIGAATAGCFPKRPRHTTTTTSSSSSNNKNKNKSSANGGGVDWTSAVTAVDLDAFEELDCPAVLRVATHGDLITSAMLSSAVGGVPLDFLDAALDQTLQASMGIAEQAAAAVAPPSKPKEHIPCLDAVPFDPRQARFIVGPNGSNIRAMEAKSGCKITLDNDRLVVDIAAPTRGAMQKAKALVEASIPGSASSPQGLTSTTAGRPQHPSRQQQGQRQERQRQEGQRQGAMDGQVTAVPHLGLKVGDKADVKVRRKMHFGLIVERDGMSSVVHKKSPGNAAVDDFNVGDEVAIRCISFRGAPHLVLSG